MTIVHCPPDPAPLEPATPAPAEPASPAAHASGELPLPPALRVRRVIGPGPADLRLRLSRLRYPRRAPLLAPLRIPERAELLLRNCGGRLLRHAILQGQATLIPGEHQLPLAGGRPFLVQVEPGTTVALQLQLGPPPGGGGEAGRELSETVVQGLEARFDPPLLLPNILNALTEVQQLFQDRQMAALLQRLRELPGQETARALGTVARELGGRLGRAVRQRVAERLGSERTARLEQRVEAMGQQVVSRLQAVRSLEPAVVTLTRVLGRLRRNQHRHAWELELAFTGHIRWVDRVSSPFHDLVLPAAVLPIFHASLDQLVDGEPLASGGLRSHRFTQRRFLQALLDSLATLTGRLSAELVLPPLTVESTTVDRTQVQVETRLPGPCHLTGNFTAAPEPGGALADGLHTLRWEMPQLNLGFAGHPDQQLVAGLRASLQVDLREPGTPTAHGPQRRVQTQAELELTHGSLLPTLELELRATHPFTHGTTTYHALLRAVRLRGGLEVATASALRVRPGPTGLTFSGQLSLPEQTFLRRGDTVVGGSLQDGTLTGTFRPVGEQVWELALQGQATLLHRITTRVTPIAELNIQDSLLRTRLECTVDLNGSAQLRFPGAQLPELTFTPGGRLRITTRQAEAELDGRRLEFPPLLLTGTVRQGGVTPAGGREIALELAWDLHGRPALLHGQAGSASLLTRELRQGELTVHISPSGRFWFSGERKGLYGVRFFNSLLKPASDPGHLLALVRSDDALSHVVAALEVFNPELAGGLRSLRELILAARRILDREQIRTPADLIPRARLARFLSLVLTGTEELAEAIAPLIRQVTEGRGLDVERTKELLRGPLREFRIDYELDGLLRWFDLVVRPSEPIPPGEVVEVPPVSEDPRYATEREGLPAAGQIYAELARPGGPDPELLRALADLAPYLSRAQLEYILQQVPARVLPEAVARLTYVAEVKRWVEQIAQGYGGIEFAAQEVTLATFLGEVVGPLPGLDREAAEDQAAPSWPPPTAIGPEETAVLLSAGLAVGRQGVQAQIHNRLLIELIRSRPGNFLLEVLIELGQHSHRALSGVLFAFLHQDQDQLQEPLDLHALVQSKLDLPVPRQEDYLAGGRRARESYYDALSRFAEEVFDRAGPYLARRAHLREVRHPLPAAAELPQADPAVAAEEQARAALAHADALGRDWLEHELAGATRPVREAYEAAWAACRSLLAREPLAVQLPWLREFWGRSEEALKVLTVVRNQQEDVDDVRQWLATVTHRPELRRTVADEQELLQTVVAALYPSPADRRALLADPLVRLLHDPPAVRYDFTIVTGMGVVTDGVDGHELEDAFRRLAERRGVAVIRSHTGLFRSLEFNAARILEAVAQVRTPWGYIGYSQGCANGLLAEHLLRTGTPDQQQQLARFVGRNLLFSAANGSVHGTSGSRKFVRAMIEGERFLKHYQASYSRETVDLVFRGLKAALDSAIFVSTLNGTYSLTLARAKWLNRDGQFAPWAPTSFLRGVIEPETIPEALEYLYYVHRQLAPGVPNDSQIAYDDAVGHATRVRNRLTEAFARCEIPSRIQATHHWSPLTVEIELITTERDRERAVYLGPKDRHVFPWVDTLARFGRIGPSGR